MRVSDIRIEGTNKININDVQSQLRSRKASAFAFLPLLGGYARGITSNAMLEEDKRTILAIMQNLGYRHADVTPVPTIPLTQDSLIITFRVKEGPLTRVAEIKVQGQQAIPDDRLRQEITIVKQAPYSPAQVRADRDQVGPGQPDLCAAARRALRILAPHREPRSRR